MNKGRKALQSAEQVGEPLGSMTEEAFAEEARINATTQGVSAELINANRLDAQIEQNNAIAKLLTCQQLIKLQELRETKGYKFLPADGQRFFSNWPDYCESKGMSYQHVNEQIKNLRTFGAEALEALHRNGVGFREMRRLARLDEQTRIAIIRGEKVDLSDPDDVRAAIEDAEAKNNKEIAQRDKRIKDLEGDLEAQRKVALKKDEKLNALDAKLHKRLADLPAQLNELQIDCVTAANEVINAVQKFTQVRLAAMGLLNGDKRDRNDDEVLGAVGVTHLQMIWQAQAWLTEELDWSEHVFGGTATEIRMHDKKGPDLTDEQIINLKNAGADEAIRVAGPRVVEGYIEHDQERAAKKKAKVED